MPQAGQDDALLLVGTCQTGLCIVDPASGTMLARLSHDVPLSNIAFGMDGNAYVTGYRGLWRIPLNKEKKKRTAPTVLPTFDPRQDDEL